MKADTNYSPILNNPRITEKGASTEGVYTFDIGTSASKAEIKKAIFKLYKVTPTKINVLRVPSKRIMMRGKMVTKHGGRKAYVHLKKGDKIEFI
jgi:large subunit ribosomal protein L23